MSKCRFEFENFCDSFFENNHHHDSCRNNQCDPWCDPWCENWCENCKERKKCKFCGKAVVDGEICFVPAVNAAKASVSVSIDPANFKVELVCCDLIVVCGFITKTVAFTDGTPTAKKDILVQVNVPANIHGFDEVDPKKWIVTNAEVCTGCFNFTCPSEDTTLFHKLVEKDIIAVLVEHKH